METSKRRTRRPAALSAEEVLTVTTLYGGESRNRQERLKVRKFLSDPAYVRVNTGITKNMGNYESLRIDVSLSIPCYPEEVDQVFPTVADRVSLFLQEEQRNYED